MLTALCLNPSFDRTVTVSGFRLGATNRAQSTREDAGGKGINVALAALRLGLEARCAGLAGEDGAERLSQGLTGLGLPHSLTPVPGAVRVNLKLKDADTGIVTEVNEPGPTVNAFQWVELRQQLLSACQGSEWVVLTGSLPPGLPQDSYAGLIAELHGQGCKCLLDASGETLRQGLTAGPELVKPNVDELRELTGQPLQYREDVARAAQRLIRAGAGCAVVSMGLDGAILAAEGRTWWAPALQVPVGSTVGAGDTMAAGLLAGIAAGVSWDEVLRCGVAAASAKVMQAGTQPPDFADYQQLLPQVTVHQLN